MLVSDLTTKSSARQGIRRPPLAGLKQREGRELARTWQCGPAPASAVASSPRVPVESRSAPQGAPSAPYIQMWAAVLSRGSESPRAPRGVSQCSPQPRVPPSPCSAGSIRGRPAELARLTCAVAAGRLPAPRSAPGLGSRHPLRAGDGCGHAGRGADPPRPEPPGASGRGGPTGERRTRGSGPGARLGTPPGSCAQWQEAQ